MSFQHEADEAPVELTADAGSSRDKSFWSDPANRPRLILIGVAAGLALIVLLLLSARQEPPTVELTPTPDDLAASPVSLSVQGVNFTIVPVRVDDSRWQITNSGADSAEWIYGTVVNYVIGLYPTDATHALVEDLVENDPILLTMSNGSELNFRMSGRQTVPADAVSELFGQTRPGVTLVVLGEGGEDRLVVTGLYDVDREPVTIGDLGLISVGQQTQLGSWRVMVLSGQLAPDPGNPTQAFYYVNFTVEFLGPDPVNADTFDLKLIDGVRNEYIIDRAVSAQGAYPPPGGQVAPRNPTSFTAGYRVPANIPGPSLTWVFKPAPDAEQAARFEAPIVKPTPTPEPNTQITVQLNSAVLSEDQTTLIIKGGVGNPTDQQVSISQVDVSLNTPDAVYSDLRSMEPPFPWMILPGQNLAFELQFTRPPGLTAILRIVTLQFELSGLR
ncbi:MAG TPA: hypothetical protein VJG32_06600 [Anaerolineae bacterium]|nr:hypothetical protein [Anaerolineae bacterium]